MGGGAGRDGRRWGDIGCGKSGVTRLGDAREEGEARGEEVARG